MTTTISETEAAPIAYPDPPAGLSTAAAALDPDAIWARIEAYITTRWTARDVVWVVEGAGLWAPPLTPATVATVEVWADGAWSAVTPEASPVGGYDFADDSWYRVTASVGGGTVPAAVLEAFRRLAEYSAAIGDFGMMQGKAGSNSFTGKVGEIEASGTRAPMWAARALQQSGAADLLRRYRRAQ
ncbi:MAG: hypothetical protein GC146_02550 [Limimaricola sp.]|uniref:hypothetical protein n=1 Tax=Limimaricola sp. TaxID=2211665 RepID=UPI001D305424|nr:hypothetical protein [Limimaricola sp.]MBI1416080.1 hypothetical protein [Limimaricola sp.]